VNSRRSSRGEGRGRLLNPEPARGRGGKTSRREREGSSIQTRGASVCEVEKYRRAVFQRNVAECAAMFFHIQLDKNIVMEARHFGKNLQDLLLEKLKSDVSARAPSVEHNTHTPADQNALRVVTLGVPLRANDVVASAEESEGTSAPRRGLGGQPRGYGVASFPPPQTVASRRSLPPPNHSPQSNPTSKPNFSKLSKPNRWRGAVAGGRVLRSFPFSAQLAPRCPCTHQRCPPKVLKLSCEEGTSVMRGIKQGRRRRRRVWTGYLATGTLVHL
jgi:hypothetical protein